MNDWTEQFFVSKCYYRADDGIILGGNSQDVLHDFPAESVSLVFTDPDYSKGSLLGYWALAQRAPRIMKLGAVLIVEVPHKYMTSIEHVFQLDGMAQGLWWRWQYCFLFLKGPQRRLRMGIRVIHKPLLCYYKGKWVNRGFVKDAFEVEPVKRTRHKWQKNLDGYKYYIERHTAPGDVVLDPFCGSGTTAFACRKLGRRFVCIDIDQNCCAEIAEELRGPEGSF